MATNPLTQAYGKLWDLLESRSGFTSLVKPGNRIRYDQSNPSPSKRRIADADTPEVEIRPATMETQPFATSTTARIEQSFILRATCSDARLTAQLYDLSWEIFKAYVATGDPDSAYHNLGLSFVVNLEAQGATDELTPGELQRGKAGWALVWNFAVLMQWTRTDLA